jgi:methylenetetrahydrofolate reductase (NADPH)
MSASTTKTPSDVQPDPKIIDLLKKEPASVAHVSLEYFPPRTEQGVKNLHARMDRMKANTKCLFTDMTWGAGGSTAELSLQIALHAHRTGHVSNLHLTCTNMEKDGDPVKAVHDALRMAFDGGVRNIVALRGDPAEGAEEWAAAEGGFACALDLVRYIRKNFGDDFGVSVAGYPEGHPNRISELSAEEIGSMSEAEKGRCCTHEGVTYVCKDDDYVKEMDYLKEKVDAGAGKPKYAECTHEQLVFAPEPCCSRYTYLLNMTVPNYIRLHHNANVLRRGSIQSFRQ